MDREIEKMIEDYARQSCGSKESCHECVGRRSDVYFRSKEQCAYYISAKGHYISVWNGDGFKPKVKENEDVKSVLSDLLKMAKGDIELYKNEINKRGCHNIERYLGVISGYESMVNYILNVAESWNVKVE